ncbi:unnamed protein product, partial [marine sediment metagenome]
MKTKKLKVEGNEKLKFELIFDLDEIKITLFAGGHPTKYTDTLTFSRNSSEDSNFEIELIGATISRLLISYEKAKRIEEYLVELFDGKE